MSAANAGATCAISHGIKCVAINLKCHFAPGFCTSLTYICQVRGRSICPFSGVCSNSKGILMRSVPTALGAGAAGITLALNCGFWGS